MHLIKYLLLAVMLIGSVSCGKLKFLGFKGPHFGFAGLKVKKHGLKHGIGGGFGGAAIGGAAFGGVGGFHKEDYEHHEHHEYHESHHSHGGGAFGGGAFGGGAFGGAAGGWLGK